jgi:transcriptional regulator with XRE-family HTH domain
VPHHRLPNYIRTFRRRSGLSQKELAMLLGATSGTKISRYENFTRMPAVNTIWACEAVFSQPAAELFAGNYEKVRLAVRARANRLLKHLAAEAPDTPPPRIARKIALLRSIVESKSKRSREDVINP